MTFNCEKYIDQSLKSILLQQTTFPFEVIISDDSYDKPIKSLQIMMKNDIKNQMTKIIWGILKNFVATLQRCNGEYVFD